MSASRRRISTWAFLLAFCLVVILPIFALEAFGIYYYGSSERQRLETQALLIAQKLNAALEGEVRSLTASLTALATSPALARGDLAEFHAQAKRLVGEGEETIVLRTMDAVQLLNSSVPYGAPLPPAVTLRAYEREILDAGRPFVSNVYKSPTTGEPRVAVAQKPLRLERPDYLLAITVPTSRFLSVLRANVPEGWIVGVGDRAGIYVTHSSRHDEVTGKPGLPSYIAQATGREGTFYGKSAAGVDLLAGYQRSDLTDWLIASNIPVERLQAPVRRSLTIAIIISGLTLLLTAVLAYLFSRQLAGSAAALAERAEALGEGRSLSPLTSGITEFGIIDRAMANAATVVAERAQLTERLASALEQKEVLLKEVNHRVKNSLQQVASLLSLQRNQIGDPQTRHQFEEAARRITVVAQVHQRLYKDDRPDQVAFDSFLREFCRDLDQVFPERRIRIECSAESFFMRNDKVVPVALILNELIANAFKYSFPDNAGGLIRVTATKEQGNALLTVADNGVKLPNNFDSTASGGLGLKIVAALSRQLRAKVEFRNKDSGKEVVLRVPL